MAGLVKDLLVCQTDIAQLALQGALLCANVAPALIELELTGSLFMDLSLTVQSNLHSIC